MIAKITLQHLGLNISATIMCTYLSVAGHQETEIWDIKDDFLKNVLLEDGSISECLSVNVKYFTLSSKSAKWWACYFFAVF